MPMRYVSYCCESTFKMIGNKCICDKCGEETLLKKMNVKAPIKILLLLIAALLFTGCSSWRVIWSYYEDGEPRCHPYRHYCCHQHCEER